MSNTPVVIKSEDEEYIKSKSITEFSIPEDMNLFLAFIQLVEDHNGNPHTERFDGFTKLVNIPRRLTDAEMKDMYRYVFLFALEYDCEVFREKTRIYIRIAPKYIVSWTESNMYIIFQKNNSLPSL
jgi:hypothetical protein